MGAKGNSTDKHVAGEVFRQFAWNLAGTPVRTIEVTAPSASYTVAEQVADFGALPASFGFTVQQLSPVFGAGHAGVSTFNA